jgi:ABC-type multidrug transport system fused ATPase/permease subunit
MRELPVADPGVPDGRSATRYLGWLARHSRLGVAGAIVWGIVWMVCQAVVPAVIGRAIDAGLSGRSGRALVLWSLILLVAGVGQAVAGVSRHRFSITNYLASAYRTTQTAVRQANRLGSSLPRAMRTGEVVAIGTTDVGLARGRAGLGPGRAAQRRAM